MKSYFLLFNLSLVLCGVSAQDKQLSMEDALVNNKTSLAPENLKQLQFIYGTGEYVYLAKKDNGDVWMRGNIQGEKPFLSLTQLNQKLRTAQLDTFNVMPSIDFKQSASWIFTHKGTKVAFDPLKNKAAVLIDQSLSEMANTEESIAGYVAYLDKFNLFISKGTERLQITRDGSADIVYASSVHRDEFGITKGTFWSNGGTKLDFYRMDQSMVTDYPIINWNARPAKNENIKYPMAGDKSHHVTIGVFNTASKSLVWLNTGEPAEQYLTNVRWSPDDKYIYVAVLNRQQNHMKLNLYDAGSGAFLKTIFEEKDEKYVEPLQPVLFVNNDPSTFVWQSSRDGWNHLYLYGENGKRCTQLTKGNWEVIDVKGFDRSGDLIFYTSSESSPISRNLYSINIKTGKKTRLTQGDYNHTVQINSTGDFILDNFSSADIPRTIRLQERSSGKSKVILQAADPLKDYALGESKIFSIKNKHLDDLYCSMRLPVNFDKSKKYPVIVYWYGGSHAQLVMNSWNSGASDYWAQYMAERGYIVFIMDTRGSDNRGKAFEQAMFRRAGEAQAEDLQAGVDYLKTLPYADSESMGLFGWSYGGFNTINFMLSRPDIFKAAVAGGPVTDWKYYEIMYTERYMDTPQENPEGYEATDLSLKVGRLKGKLLLIHGMQDNVVVQQHSVKFLKAAVDKGVQVDYMLYPGHEHNVLGKDRAHLYQKVTDYFMQNLK